MSPRRSFIAPESESVPRSQASSARGLARVRPLVHLLLLLLAPIAAAAPEGAADPATSPRPRAGPGIASDDATRGDEASGALVAGADGLAGGEDVAGGDTDQRARGVGAATRVTDAKAQWELVPHLSAQLLGTVGGGRDPALAVRRLRFGVRLEGPAWIQGNFELMHEPVALTPGLPARAPRLRDARLGVRLPEGPWLSVGVLRPQLGRENLTPPFMLDSAEKASALGPLRLHLTGDSSAVAPGINLGDLVRLGAARSLRYDLGIVLDRPGLDGAPRPALLVGRASMTFGEPEAAAYALILPGFRPSRPGFTLGLQGSVDTSARSGSVGVDLLQLGQTWSFSIESHLIAERALTPLLASSARLGLHLAGGGKTELAPYLLVSHLWRRGEAAALDLGAGLAWWIDADRLRVSLGAGSRLLSAQGPRTAVDRTPRAELMFQFRI